MQGERTGVISSRHLFDLDDIRPEVGEEHRRGRARQYASEVDDLDAFERRGYAFCAAMSWNACLVQSSARGTTHDVICPAAKIS